MEETQKVKFMIGDHLFDEQEPYTVIAPTIVVTLYDLHGGTTLFGFKQVSPYLYKLAKIGHGVPFARTPMSFVNEIEKYEEEKEG